MQGMKPVRMYTTQVCPFCVRAKALLKQRGVDQIEEIRVDLHPAERDTMVSETGRRTATPTWASATTSSRSTSAAG
jgi:glutaredoxin 3